MREFNITLDDKPGALAVLCEKLTMVNINGISTERQGDGRTLVRIVTNDEVTTTSILDKSNMPYTTDEILAVDLKNQPGELKKLARKLAKSSININSIYIIGKHNGSTRIAVNLDKTKEGRKLLASYN